MDTRILFYKSGSLLDYTIGVNNYFTHNDNLFDYNVGDFLYIGMKYPFNHLYFKYNSPNDVVTNLKIEVFCSTQFEDVAEVIDETKQTTSFERDGHIVFTPDKYKYWTCNDTVSSNGSEFIPNLGTVKIYDYYWARLSFTDALNAATSLAFIGHLFSNDMDLEAEFPDLLRVNTLNYWDKTGTKTNWGTQHYLAAQLIIKELKDKKVIFHRGQILEKSDLTNASVALVAHIAFKNMGPEFSVKAQECYTLYKERINQSIHHIDSNKNAILDPQEIEKTQPFLHRGSY